MDEGFPRQALLMTVVKDEHNEGHAILTVKTNAGEFILEPTVLAPADIPFNAMTAAVRSNVAAARR